MTIHAENDLRTALHERAARVHASRRLLTADYRPRARRIWPQLAVGGVATAAAGVAAALMLTGGAGNAFAGWTPQPTTPAPAQLAAAEAYCAANMGFPNLPLKLVDARGPFTFIVYSDDTSNDFCTTGPSFQNSSGWQTSSPLTVPSGRLFLWSEHTTTDSGPAYTFVIARAADDVSAADLTLDDGTDVSATVSNGWAVAWWPGTSLITSAQLTTAAGTQTQTFGPCAVHSCSGGPHGGGPGGSPGGG